MCLVQAIGSTEERALTLQECKHMEIKGMCGIIDKLLFPDARCAMRRGEEAKTPDLKTRDTSLSGL